MNTKSVKPGQKLYYQVWLDTTQFDANNKDHIQTVGITDDYDETKLDVDASAIKAYDSVSGADVTSKFDIKVENGVVTANLKDGSLSHLAMLKTLKLSTLLSSSLVATINLIFLQQLRKILKLVWISKIQQPKLLTTTTQQLRKLKNQTYQLKNVLTVFHFSRIQLH